MREPCYKVSFWDHERQRWCSYVSRSRKWGLRKALRSLYRHGWDTPTILVERRDGAEGRGRDVVPPKRLRIAEV